MPTNAPDRDDLQTEPGQPNPPSADPGPRDAFELWQDIGGSD